MSLLASMNARSRGRYDRNASGSRTSQPAHYVSKNRRNGGGALSFATKGSVGEHQRPTAVQILTERDIQYDLESTTSHGQVSVRLLVNGGVQGPNLCYR